MTNKERAVEILNNKERAVEILDKAFEVVEDLGFTLVLDTGERVTVNDLHFQVKRLTVEEIIAKEMPGYKIVEDPNPCEHENLQVVFLEPKERVPHGPGPTSVVVSVKQGKIIGKQG